MWAWDFVFDDTTSGSQLKWLSIVDEHTRECLALKVDRNITSEDVVDTLAELFAMRGVPKCVRSDNGPEFIAQAIGRWLDRVDVETLHIEPRIYLPEFGVRSEVDVYIDGASAVHVTGGPLQTAGVPILANF